MGAPAVAPSGLDAAGLGAGAAKPRVGRGAGGRVNEGEGAWEAWAWFGVCRGAWQCRAVK